MADRDRVMTPIPQAMNNRGFPDRYNHKRMGCLMAVFFALVAIVHDHNKYSLSYQPEFSGLTLRQWIQKMDDANTPTSDITKAFQEIGPRGVPYLLQLSQEEDGPLTKIYLRCYALVPNQLRSFLPFPTTAGLRRQRCHLGLYLCVRNAKSSRDVGYLVQALDSPNPRDKILVLNLLGTLGNSSEIAKRGIIKSLSSKEKSVRGHAALMLFHIDPLNPVGVPQLIEMLNFTNPLLRSDAALALGRTGTGNSNVIKALEWALSDISEYVRHEARESLKLLGAR